MIIHLDTKDDQFSDLINLIEKFPTSTQFFDWFGGSELQYSTHFEQKGDSKFQRVGKYFLDGLEIFSGGGEFSLDKMDPSFAKAVDQKKFQYVELLPELKKLDKVKISSTLSDNSWTVISHFFYLNQLCGVCWEIYELNHLLELYKKRGLRLEPESSSLGETNKKIVFK